MTCITDAAHEAVRVVLQPGETAVDATCGNGHDTLFLANAVGPDGCVFAFDVQPAAITATRQRLEVNGVSNVTLLHRSHEELFDSIPTSLHGLVGAVMFNLGYMPGSDRQVCTQRHSTRLGMSAAAEMLRPGGVLTVISYSGHPGGADERATVERFMTDLPGEQFRVERHPFGAPGPTLFVARKV